MIAKSRTAPWLSRIDRLGKTDKDADRRRFDMNARCKSLIMALMLATVAGGAQADDAQIQRGKYLIQISGCSDCHTPGGMLGQADMARYLGGSDVGFAIPGVGIYVGQNLTPDQETGLGGWS